MIAETKIAKPQKINFSKKEKFPFVGIIYYCVATYLVKIEGKNEDGTYYGKCIEEGINTSFKSIKQNEIVKLKGVVKARYEKMKKDQEEEQKKITHLLIEKRLIGVRFDNYIKQLIPEFEG